MNNYFKIMKYDLLFEFAETNESFISSYIIICDFYTDLSNYLAIYNLLNRSFINSFSFLKDHKYI